MAIARRTSSSTRSTRRQTVWARASQTGLGVPTTGFNKVNLLGAFETDYGANLIGATIVRVRGAIAAVPSPSPASTAGQFVFAARIANDNELATGNNPYDQPHLDWALWEPFVYAPGADLRQSGDSSTLSRVIDVKSQRKLGEVNEEFSLFMQSAGVAFAVTYQLSILLKLP